MLTITRIYEQTIKPLPAADRLRLAVLILNDIPAQSVVDYRDEWTEEDYLDFSRASWGHVDKCLENEENA